jgi:2-dehydropantoate 2-reductase
MMASPHTRELARALMEEVRTGARACGREIATEFLDAMVLHTERMLPYRTSMKIDFEGGRPMEVEAIYGNPLRLARSFGVDLPGIAVLYRQLQFLDGRLRAKRAGPPILQS